MKVFAICGAPDAGKTTVQNILRKEFDILAVDDGWPMRDFAMRHLGLTHADVYTQDGKEGTAVFPGGHEMSVREALGKLGYALDDIFGPNAIPAMAYARGVKKSRQGGWKGFSLASVRRDQGVFFKNLGATVIEVIRPGFQVTNSFDDYNRDVIDVVINNKGDLNYLNSVTKFAARVELGL